MLQVSLLWFDWNMFDIIELKRLLSPMLRCRRCRFELSTVTILHLCAPCASTTSSKVEVTRKCSKSQSMCCQTAHKLTGLKISEDIVSSCWTTKKHQLHPMYSVIQGNSGHFWDSTCWLTEALLKPSSMIRGRTQNSESCRWRRPYEANIFCRDVVQQVESQPLWLSSPAQPESQPLQHPWQLYPANGLGKRVNLLNSVLGSAQSPFFGYFFNKVHSILMLQVINKYRLESSLPWRFIWKKHEEAKSDTHTHSDIPDIYFLWLILKHSRMKFCIYLYRAAFGQFTWHVTWPACSILIANCLAYSCILTHEVQIGALDFKSLNIHAKQLWNQSDAVVYKQSTRISNE